MAKNSSYRVKLRRRREGKTDYQARKALVTSRRPRLVTRASIRNVTAQIIIAKQQGDEVLVAANSRELIKNFGWKAPTGNIPAAYLTGLLCGLKAKAKGIEGAILDLGLVPPTKGSKTFAILSGVVDAGVEVPHSEEKLVRERIKGDHIAEYAESLSDEQEVYAAKFSKYIAAGVAPEKVAEHFSKVRANIVGSFKGAKVAPEPESKPKAKAPKAVPKVEAKAAPKAEAKAPKAEAKEAPKTEAKAEPKAEVKEAKAPKAEAKVEEPKAEAKAQPKAEAKAAPKAKAPKQKAPKEKAPPQEKPTKKGEKKA
jgi:large subunit ribosomal protein L18